MKGIGKEINKTNGDISMQGKGKVFHDSLDIKPYRPYRVKNKCKAKLSKCFTYSIFTYITGKRVIKWSKSKLHKIVLLSICKKITWKISREKSIFIITLYFRPVRPVRIFHSKVCQRG